MVEEVLVLGQFVLRLLEHIDILGDSVGVGVIPHHLGGEIDEFGRMEAAAVLVEMVEELGGRDAGAIELERINMALELADGIVSEAARLLTLKRTTLIEKMRKYGVGNVD